jgi:FkbM family methyltransferase
MTTLVYIGANQGHTLWGMFDKYDDVYAFEPDPEMFETLKKTYKQFEWVTLVNAACSFEDGESDFYVTPNRVSSSLSDASVNEKSLGCPDILKKIKVKTINLANFLKENNIEYVDFYMSDAQGSDLNILKTINEFIIDKKIGEFFIETHGNGIEIYDGLDNQFDGFKEILSENYEFVHASLGSQNGKIVEEKDIPEGEKEWDSYWRLK